ncbi:hypothetical protein AJ88_26990 [Mesorhizobium amorphae CCBAU 01583]|nr:hypothetical protein AJ88_26990 [Mesorhizobium amorphae CCBAU 01583]
MTEVIFKEAGLGTFDPLAQRRRTWIWRGAAAACTAAALLAGGLFTWSYFDNRNAITAQAGQFEALQAPLTMAGENPPSVEQPAIDGALGAMDEVAIARTAPPDAVQDLLGPSASAELVRAQADTYDHALRNVLEPHMVALLEATMWRQIRDPDFMLGALKTYRMMTGLSQMDADFAQNWWVNSLPEFSPAPPFPTTDAEEHQLAAIRRMAVDDNYIAPDKALVAEALKTVCTISLPQRAYKQLLADPEVAAVKEWIPANFAGPNGARSLPAVPQDASRRRFRRLHLCRLPRCRSRPGRGCGGTGRTGSRGVCRRLFGEFRNLGLGTVGGYSKALLRRLHCAMGQFPARYEAGATERPECRQRKPQGPFQRRLRAETAADGGDPGDGSDPVG